MMLDFDSLRTLRDQLVDSLIEWGRNDDGLYRSSPTSRSTPSFTNTGIVLQALTESRNAYLAHRLAERLLGVVAATPLGLFPHEKAQAPGDAHVMSNAWPSFALLDASPARVGEIAPICEWLLKTQREEDGSWSLVPGDLTREPIVTGYAMSALQQFLRCALQARRLERTSAVDIARVTRSIELAVGYLQDARPEGCKKTGTFLWPASLSAYDSGPLSLGTSALCMHVLAKWGRFRGRRDLVDGVASTFRQIVAGFEGAELHVEVAGQRLALWDQFHLNEGRLNYMWAFFAPISVVTLLRFPEILDDRTLRFIEHFVRWIQLHARTVDERTVGISGSETLSEVKVWSTAEAVIVLSRVLDMKGLLSMDVGYHRPLVELHEGIRKVAGAYVKPPSRGQLSAAAVVGMAIVGAILYSAWRWIGAPEWQRIEGPVTFAMILCTIVSILGLTSDEIRQGLIGLVGRIVRLGRVAQTMSRFEQLLARADAVVNTARRG